MLREIAVGRRDRAAVMAEFEAARDAAASERAAILARTARLERRLVTVQEALEITPEPIPRTGP